MQANLFRCYCVLIFFAVGVSVVAHADNAPSPSGPAAAPPPTAAPPASTSAPPSAAPAAAAPAATPDNGAKPSTPSTGLGVGIGDVIILRVDTPGFRAVDGTNPPPLCAGYGTALKVSSVSEDGGKTLYVRVPDKGDFSNVFFIDTLHGLNGAKECTEPNKTAKLSPGQQYAVSTSVFANHEYSASGLEYGILLAPYKFHIANRSLTTSATIGPYVGYHLFSSPGSTISEVVSIGIGSVSVPSTSTSPAGTVTTSTSNQVSLSLAQGVVWTLTKSGTFQMAFLVGIDWLGRGSGYQYEGKPWVGIGFGTNITK
jgi:hypothetical protein